ncbi:MAG: UbiA prenyltransferase family protein [Pseudomonadota bacterium]
MAGETDDLIEKTMLPKKVPHAKLMPYLKLIRPDHWFKHIFILPGFVIAYIFVPVHPANLLGIFVIGFIAICLICSANYIINEWLDRDFDKFHPTKKNRSSVVSDLNPHYVFLEYILFVMVGLGLSLLISTPFLITNLALLIMGIFYNIKPFRTKDIPYIDVLTESVNIPLRLLLGWFMVTSIILPPPVLVLAYWMGGAFLMATKRFSELLFIKDHTTAGQYRRSFQYYSTEKLLISAFFYAVSCAFFGGVFLMNFNSELIYTFPLYGILFAWYFHIAFKPNSVAQHPEYIYREKYFCLFVIFLTALTIFLLYDFTPVTYLAIKNIFLGVSNV